jgi:hypothetical protein
MRERLLIAIICSGLMFSQAAYGQQPQAIKEALEEDEAVAEDADNDGQFVLHMMSGRANKNIRVPAMILDSYRGIVWTCQNIQDGKPLWVKTDLAQNGSKVLTRKKYIAKMLEWQNAALRVPAVVLDIEEGVVWNCPNIVDGNATWIRKNLSGVDEVIVK